jgi:transcriptional regulator with XRE-family HTH domain
MTAPKVLFGGKFRAERTRLGVKQSDVAAAVGVTSVSVSRWERDETEPGLAEFIRLGQYFGRSVAWFLDNGASETVTAPPPPAPAQLIAQGELVALAAAREAIDRELARSLRAFIERFDVDALPPALRRLAQEDDHRQDPVVTRGPAHRSTIARRRMDRPRRPARGRIA